MVRYTCPLPPVARRVVFDKIFCQVDNVQASAIRRDQHSPIGQFFYQPDGITRKTCGFHIVVHDAIKLPGLLVVDVYTRVIGSCPDPAPGIFKKSYDGIPAEGVKVVRVIGKNFKAIAIVAVKSIICTYPGKTAFVLNNAIHFIM